MDDELEFLWRKLTKEAKLMGKMTLGKVFVQLITLGYFAITCGCSYGRGTYVEVKTCHFQTSIPSL